MSAYTNTGTALDRILEARRIEVEHRKCVLPQTALKYGAKAASPLRDFTAALSRDGLNIIAELKPASPSRGVIREPFDAPELAKTLAHAGAAALSVLTEGEFFHGSLKNLRDARKAVPVPVLRKDFIFDPWQVWEARANDADSFLLIVAALEDGLLRELMDLGREIGMEAVVEVHTRAELERAVGASARIIGVNNRDLKTMTVHVQTSFELIDQIPEDCIAVSESGIRSHEDLLKIRSAGFDAFLVGEHLMLAADPAAALSELLGQGVASPSTPDEKVSFAGKFRFMTRVKICGITSVADALAACEAGADMLGLNFYSQSPRFVSVERAAEIRAELCAEVCAEVRAGVKVFGVFVNADPAEITEVAKTVKLDAVQLHGDEDRRHGFANRQNCSGFQGPASGRRFFRRDS